MNPAKLSFIAEISDGYSFRNLMSIIKSEIDVTHLVATPKGLEISFLNKHKCNCHQVFIRGSELSSYIYNFRDENGELLPFAPMAFETNRMMTNTKTIGRKDAIIIYKNQNENKICINPVKTDSKSASQSCALFVDILNDEYSPVTVSPKYTEVNVKVPAKEFSSFCSQTNTSKCSYLKIYGCEDYVKLEGILPNKATALKNTFYAKNTLASTSSDHKVNDLNSVMSKIDANNSTDEDNDKVKFVHVDISSVKAFSKIHNVSPQHTQLKFYFCDSNVIKVDSPIGMYGQYLIFMRSSKA